MSEQCFKNEHGRHQKFSISCNNANYFANCWFHRDLFSAAVLQPLAWSDRLCLCWLFICRLSLCVFLMLIFPPGPRWSPESSSCPSTHCQPGQASLRGNEFWGSKRCCCCSQLLSECRDDLPHPPLPPRLKTKESSQEAKQLVRERAAGACWGQWPLAVTCFGEGLHVSPESKVTRAHTCLHMKWVSL